MNAIHVKSNIFIYFPIVFLIFLLSFQFFLVYALKNTLECKQPAHIENRKTNMC